MIDLMSNAVEKVVYVLGAGFSKPAGAPNQAEILETILGLQRSDDRTQSAVQSLRDFLHDDLGLAPQERMGRRRPSREDHRTGKH
jgi:hypothetical protein